MTTKRAFTMLPKYWCKVEEYEKLALPDGAILVTRTYFAEFLEWIENELYSEDQHFLEVEEKNILHEEKGHKRVQITRTHHFCSRRKRHMRFR